MITKRALLLGLTAAFGLRSARFAHADAYPDRTIKIILPFPPGGNAEAVARSVANRLSASLGQPVIIDHLPGGAAGTVGTRVVARANPDGYTLLLSPPNPLVVAPAIYPSLDYDPAKAFAPIATLFSSPQLLAVNPSIPVNSINDLVAYAKANPGKINFASPGYGTQPHLLGEMLRLAAQIDIVHVPYKGPGQAVTDLLGGQVQMYFETVSFLLPHIQAKTLKALAVADDTRSPQLPEVPTTAESGFPNLQATYWTGILAPSHTPRSIVDRLNAMINEAVKSPEINAFLTKISATPKIGSPEDFAAFMAAERQKWTTVVNAAGVKIH